MLRTVAMIFGIMLFAPPLIAGDFYAPLEDSKGRLVGVCSAGHVADGIWDVRARHVQLPPNSALSSWGIAGGPQHLDGTITGASRSYVFQGLIDDRDTDSIRVVVLDHGKPDPDILIGEIGVTGQITSPSDGCDGSCPSVGGCMIVINP